MDQIRPRWCPACGKEWERGEACRDCLVDLVVDPTEMITCRTCGAKAPATREACLDCFTEFHVDGDEVQDAILTSLKQGIRLPRPPGFPAFRNGANCTLLRAGGRGGLVIAGTDGLLEASVTTESEVVKPPLTCRDLDGSTLFQISRYEPAGKALVALGPDDTPVATYLLRPGPFTTTIDVRDESSAPAARFENTYGDSGFNVIETGGGVVAHCYVRDVITGDWIDDQWSLRTTSTELPLSTFALLGLLVAAKALFGRPKPTSSGDSDEELLRQTWSDLPYWL